ncbi:MAG: energy transducer TonB [Sphingobacteriaceae bacterium]|nr:MAG: energy transducer TonB [Sphingobacteriaceae bacterium]
MKTLFFVTLINFAIIFKAKSQDIPQYLILKHDTVNIRGIIYDDLGKPAIAVIFPKGKEYPFSVKTNSEGRFFIKGAQIRDTFIINFVTGNIAVVNNGSRYLEIHLPKSNKPDLTSGNLIITAKRRYSKNPIPEIKLENKSVFDSHWFEQPAGYPGGNIKFDALIKDNITYPEKAIINNIEGDVKIAFIVNEEGLLTNFKVLRGIGYGCEEQVINAIKKSPKWRPAIFMGNASSMPSSITINFKLTDK